MRNVDLKIKEYLNTYIGTFKCGLKHGDGQSYLTDGVYDGNWKKNKRSGYGIMWYNDGIIYIGEWMNDKYHGHGVLVQCCLVKISI